MIQRNGRFPTLPTLAAIALLMLAAGVAHAEPDTVAANRLYVVVSPGFVNGPTAVTVFGLDAEGRPRQGETVATGGLGGAFSSPQGVVATPRGDLLFVANNQSGDVSVLRILADGSLDPLPAPFPIGGVPAYLAMHPSGELLYVGDIGTGSVRVFEIDASGALSAVQTAFAGFPAELEVHPDGDRLFVAAFTGVRVFDVAADGRLTEVAGSPFPAPGTRTLHLELDSRGDRLFALDLDRGIVVYDVAASGALEPIGDAPTFVSPFATTLELGEGDSFVYAGSPFEATVDVFRVLGGGRLNEVVGSPFAADFVPVEILNPRGTSRLYEIGAGTRRISVFEIGSNGRLAETPGSPFDVVDDEGRVPNGAAVVSRPIVVLPTP